jgi:propanol-preferring alcohol dehydrogenase
MQELPVPEVGPTDVLVQVKAAGICHSDVHYRAGISPVHPLPLTLGHEVAGVVEQVGSDVPDLEPGDRVVLHYLLTCGDCLYCTQGNEQFCTSASMIGKYSDGGYAEYIRVPARNAFLLPDEISFAQGAVMMCSSATSLHALRKGRMEAGETVAVYGVGGLGMSAVQLAKALGALDVYAVDINATKLQMAQELGAIPVDASQIDPVLEILRLTGERGVDVTLELIGLPMTMRQAIQSLALFGRAVMVGLGEEPIEIVPYRELILKEREIIGASDHLAQELPLLIELARRGALDLEHVVTDTVPLDAAAINAVMDRLEQYSGDVRVVIVPD